MNHAVRKDQDVNQGRIQGKIYLRTIMEQKSKGEKMEEKREKYRKNENFCRRQSFVGRLL
jgi:hypothetical protein